jgi:hypothetical protein
VTSLGSILKFSVDPWVMHASGHVCQLGTRGLWNVRRTRPAASNPLTWKCLMFAKGSYLQPCHATRPRWRQGAQCVTEKVWDNAASIWRNQHNPDNNDAHRMVWRVSRQPAHSVTPRRGQPSPYGDQHQCNILCRDMQGASSLALSRVDRRSSLT